MAQGKPLNIPPSKCVGCTCLVPHPTLSMFRCEKGSNGLPLYDGAKVCKSHDRNPACLMGEGQTITVNPKVGVSKVLQL